MIGTITYGSFTITQSIHTNIDGQTAIYRISTFLHRIGYAQDLRSPLTFTRGSVIGSTYNPRSWSATVEITLLQFPTGVQVIVKYSVAGLSNFSIAGGQDYFNMEAARLTYAAASGQIEEAVRSIEEDTRGRRRSLVNRLLFVYGAILLGLCFLLFIVGFLQLYAILFLIIGSLLILGGVYRVTHAPDT